MYTPLVSLITVCLNSEKFIENTIRSVREQTYKNIEYIIIDGGSTDGTTDIIKKYADKIDYWVSEKDEGIYDAMNKGISLANGELIGLLNADDYYESDAVEAIVATYLSNRSPCIIYGNTYVIQEDLNITYKLYSNKNYWKGMCCCHQAMFVHREIYERIGKYDLRYKVASDYDFFLRALDKNVPLVPIDKFIVYFRNTGSSFTNLVDSLNEKRIINKKYFDLFSVNHMKYLLVYMRSMTLIALQKIIQIMFGGKILLKIRIIYTKIFISKEQEVT